MDNSCEGCKYEGQSIKFNPCSGCNRHNQYDGWGIPKDNYEEE